MTDMDASTHLRIKYIYLGKTKQPVKGSILDHVIFNEFKTLVKVCVLYKFLLKKKKTIKLAQKISNI